jgi:HK97 family phage major capsid protein
MLVPYTIDPTIIGTSNGAVNPLRAISRVESTVTNTWKGVTSAGVTAAYATEAQEASDNSPTLVQPEVTALRAQACIPFSIELDQDFGQLRADLSRLLTEAKDELEATQFVTGTGVPNKPQGVVTGVGTSVVTCGGSAAFAVADLYKLEEGVPPRSRPRSKIIGNKFIFNKVRQFDTSGGAALWVRLEVGQPPELIGYPAYECSAMAAALTTGQKIMLMGDFQQYLVVDRTGMDVSLIPHLVGSTHLPIGSRAIYALWRNSAVILNPDAFRILVTG